MPVLGSTDNFNSEVRNSIVKRIMMGGELFEDLDGLEGTGAQMLVTVFAKMLINRGSKL